MPGTYDAGLHYSAARATPRTLSQSDLAEMLTVSGWVHDNAEPVCIVMAESSGKTDAESANPAGGKNIGIFQIWSGNVQHPEYLKDPVYSANVARRMWSEDHGSFKRWATAGQCAGKSGNAPLSDEASPVGIAADVANIPNQVAGALTGVLNSIPWFRLGKGALGFALVVIGAGTLIVVVANKAPTPARAVRRAIK